MSSNPDLYTFIFESYEKLQALNEVLAGIKQEVIDYINNIYGTEYEDNDFYIQPVQGGSAVDTTGYYSEGYEESCSYQLGSLNSNITTTASIYLNANNTFTVNITTTLTPVTSTTSTTSSSISTPLNPTP